MIDSSLWEILVTFSQYGTLSAAAERLFVSQPSLSTAMKKLEKELGISLFERRKNKLILNEVGLEAVRLAQEHINSEKSIIRHLQDMSRRLSAITIGSYVSGLLESLSDRLSSLYPQRTIITEQLPSEMLPRGLLDGHFDYVITEYPIDEPEITCVPYIADHLMIRLPLGDPLMDRDSITAHDISDSKLLVWTQCGFWASFIRRNFSSKNLVFVSDQKEYHDLIHAFKMRSFTLESVIHMQDHNQYCYVPLAEHNMQVTFYLCSLKQNEHVLPALLPK